MTQEELNKLSEEVKKAKEEHEKAERKYQILKKNYDDAFCEFTLSNSSFPYKVGEKVKYTRKYESNGYEYTEEGMMIIDNIKTRHSKDETWAVIICHPEHRPTYEDVHICMDFEGNVLWSDDEEMIEKIK
jgi:hypothetical protein